MLEIATDRLRLRRWREDHKDAFAAMNADAEVMRDLGGPITRIRSDAKLERYAQVFDRCAFGRWAIEAPVGGFLGYAGLMPVGDDHPLGPHVEIGWRLVRRAWGRGLASEAARAALRDGFERMGFPEVVAYTASDNVRSQAVMARLGLRREPSRDVVARYEGVGEWSGLVWATSAP